MFGLKHWYLSTLKIYSGLSVHTFYSGNLKNVHTLWKAPIIEWVVML